MGSWGKKTHWARAYFSCAVPHAEMPPSKRPRPPAPSDRDVGSSPEVLSNSTLMDHASAVTYECSRCHSAVTVPRIPSTGRPDLLLLAQHLEGGECSAGVLLFADALAERNDRTEALRLQDEATLTAFLADLHARQQSSTATGSERRKDIVFIWLMNPKTPQNMGSVLRAMSVYQDGAAVVYSGNRYDIAAKFSTDPHDGGVSIPKLHVHDMAHALEFLAHRRSASAASAPSQSPLCMSSARFVAVDLITGAVPLHRYSHDRVHTVDEDNSPYRRLVGYVFGPEDGTLSDEILGACREAVYVPTNGSMNLAATVNVLLYDRQAKHLHQHPDDLRALSEEATGGRSINNQRTVASLGGGADHAGTSPVP